MWTHSSPNHPTQTIHTQVYMQTTLYHTYTYIFWIPSPPRSGGLSRGHLGHVPQALCRPKQNRPKIGPKILKLRAKKGPDV